MLIFTMIHIKKIVNFLFLHFVVILFLFMLNRAADNLDHLAELRNKKNLSGSIAKEHRISNPHHGSKMRLKKKPNLWRLKYVFEDAARFLE